NGYSITETSINSTGDTKYGVGFFGAISDSARIRNVHLHQVSIESNNTETWFVGGLVGVANKGIIKNSHVIGGDISGSYFVGGLVGSAVNDSLIENSYVVADKVQASRSGIGGLVGNLQDSLITSSYARTNLVESQYSTGGQVGGLVGQMTNSDLLKSYADNLIVTALGSNIGGLVGYLASSRIDSSYAISHLDIAGHLNIGGLVGRAKDASKVYASYARSNSVAPRFSAKRGVAGFVGYLGRSPTIANSYSFNRNRILKNGFGGFISNHRESPDAIKVHNSYSVAPSPLISIPRFGLIKTSDSYWDKSIATIEGNSLDTTARTTSELKSPTSFGGDFANWGKGWCDPTTGRFTAEQSVAIEGGYGNNTAWDLGSSTQYPALTCLLDLTPEQQFELNERFLD
ncbi:MAG: hypothetical protein HAW61_04690, partial [Candidatus Portiera sp.]|nr:hypothetical protein [Portiera sp.]